MIEQPSAALEATESTLDLLPRAKVAFIMGLELCSRVLWDTATRISEDQSQAHSERLAIVKVLKEIHDQIKAEMEKINGKPNQSTGVSGDFKECKQASE